VSWHSRVPTLRGATAVTIPRAAPSGRAPVGGTSEGEFVRSRTKVLSALAAAAVTVPAAIAAITLTTAEASAPGTSTIPLTITNNSGRSERVFVYVLGQSLTSNKLGYATESGEFRAWTGGGPVPEPAPNVAIAGPAKGETKTIQIPQLSGRVYFSFGDEIKFFLTRDGLVQPAPWNPSDPNVDVLFDWSEFTLNDSGLWLNSSQVDMFAVPHSVSVTSHAGVTRKTGEVVNNGRNRVLDAIKNQPGWSKSIMTRKDGTRLRALAPGKAADAGLFSRTYLDPYINSVWNTYRTRTLTVVPWDHEPHRRFTGRVDAAGSMNFTDTSGAKVASFKKPSTADVWGCDGNLAAPNDPPFIIGAISRTLCAGFHRSTLGTIHTQPSKDPKQFYKGLITNHYSRKIHNHMADGKAYGFAFDDVGAFESLVHDPKPKSANITLSPF
jgi:hypothetical protein